MIIAELSDQCNLKCALCPTRFRKQTKKQMSLATVKKILDQYKGHWIHWFNWGEPLLHNKFIEVANLVEGSLSRLSTNLSLKLPDEYFKAMRKFRIVIVSLSGMTKEIYGINHKGGNFDLVMSNLDKLLSFRANPRDTQINWLRHKYNDFQEPIIKAFCEKNHITFNPCFMVCTVEELMNNFSHELLVEPKFQASGRSMCRIINWNPIDVEGDYVLCCTTQNIKIGYNINDNVSFDKLIKVRMKTKVCKECRKRELWRMFS